MSRNEGTLDRVLRIILGLVLLSLIFVGPQTMWGLVGIVPLVTGLFGICPVYSVLGIKTCRAKPSAWSRKPRYRRRRHSHRGA